jgi:hypothetical protein
LRVTADAVRELGKTPVVVRQRHEHSMLTAQDEQALVLGRLLDDPDFAAPGVAVGDVHAERRERHG